MQITLVIDEKDLDLIWLWLSELPYKYSAKLLGNIKNQYELQKDKKEDLTNNID